MTWHHHHHGDMYLGEHFDIDDPDPDDFVQDNVIVHEHEESHFPGKEPCADGCVVLEGKPA